MHDASIHIPSVAQEQSELARERAAIKAAAPGPTLPPVDEVYERASYTADMNGLSEAELAERRAQMEEVRTHLEAWHERITSAIRDHDMKIARCDRALNALRGNDEPQEAVAR